MALLKVEWESVLCCSRQRGWGWYGIDKALRLERLRKELGTIRIGVGVVDAAGAANSDRAGASLAAHTVGRRVVCGIAVVARNADEAILTPGVTPRVLDGPV